ncbi:MAG: bifunctional homocysteine S-methyltransferase/methylenetetrahydrofolate reductase [Gaiellales bacterium]
MATAVLERFGDRPLVADGGIGSLLSAAVPRARCPEHANLIAPEQVVKLHLAFIAAGSDLIETNTYGANPFKLAALGLEDQAERIVQAGVKLAREAREVSGREVVVAGSIGPTGDPPGSLDRERAGPMFAHQARLLEGRGVDLLVLETFTSLEELRLAFESVREVTRLPVIAEVTVGDDAETPAGDRAGDVAAAMEPLAPLAVGVNCSLGPHSVLAALEEMRGATSLPLTALANAGLPNLSTGRVIYPDASPEYFAEYAAHAVRLGAMVIGGCCGTGPVHVAAVRDAVSEQRAPATALALVERDVPASAPGEAAESPLQARLRRGEFVVSVELDPPKGANVERMIATARRLAEAGGVDCFDVNDSPLARARMNALVASALIEQQVGVETIPHVTPRDASVRGIESMLLGAHAVGIRNVLAVTGDPPPSGDPRSGAVYEVDAIGLTRLIAAMNHGTDESGKALDAPTAFHIGVAVNPAADDVDEELVRFERKLEAGAQFAMTQVLFEPATLERFLQRLGGRSPVPLLIGVWPLSSHSLALRLHNEVPGIVVGDSVLGRLERAGAAAAVEGMAVAREMLDAARALAAGAYLVPPFKEPEAVLELLV